MNIIQFAEANCKNCYKCIRRCPVKAISFKEEQARIIDNECILCGSCVLTCPQNAKQIQNDTSKIKSFIARGEKVYVSMAPSYAAAFPGTNIQKMSAALARLGFAGTEETAIGAGKVSAEYAALMAQHKMKNIITTACPTVVLLVEKYFPDLVEFLAPVVSPMVAHCRLLKEAYGSRIKTVFIGPCFSKKYEVLDPANENAVNAVLTFDELYEWFAQNNIDPSSSENGAGRDLKGVVNRFYPIPGGILRTIRTEEKSAYRTISVDGVERGIKILESLRDPNISGYFIEFNACSGACLEGPSMKLMNKNFLPSKELMLKNVKSRGSVENPVTEDMDVNFKRRYFDMSPKKRIPTEEEITRILHKFGKTSPELELNCAGCGYQTCREKAVAVFEGKADINMCLPYMRERAESLSNKIIDNTPNALIVLDGDLNISEFNPAARVLMKLGNNDYTGMPIETVLACDDFNLIRENHGHIERHKVTYKDLDLTVLQQIFPIENAKSYVLMLEDISKEEHNLERISKVRNETIDAAQLVINKQMRVAQEIASLLGETTAETKVVLTRLKKSVGTENEAVK